jgi:hypothetical protein
MIILASHRITPLVGSGHRRCRFFYALQSHSSDFNPPVHAKKPTKKNGALVAHRIAVHLTKPSENLHILYEAFNQ